MFPVTRASFVWLLIMAVETIHGILREILLTPYIGDFRARQIGVLIGSVLILGLCLLTVRWMIAGILPTKGVLIQIGLLWTALTLVFEFGLGTALGRTIPEMMSDYDLAGGGLMPLGLIVLVLSPSIAAKMRGV
jgi:hypothetical protein